MRPAILAFPLLFGCLDVGSASGIGIAGSPYRDDEPQEHVSRSTGIVTGNIYNALDQNPEAFMEDLASLGAHWMRIEINDTDLSKFERIGSYAHDRGMQVLAVVQSSALFGHPDPRVANIDDYAAGIEYVIERLDVESEIHYFEIENEPDVFDFKPLTTVDHHGAVVTDNADRYALLMTRVYEHEVARRGSATTPQIVGFSFNRYDDDQSYVAVWNSPSITNHRKYFRAGRGLPDGLPCDIIGVHGYGNPGAMPAGHFTWAGASIDGGLDLYFGTQFHEAVRGNTSIFTSSPVWFTEVGFDRQVYGEQGQSDAMTQEFAALRARNKVQVAFWYDYRDDQDVMGKERDGLESADGSHDFLAKQTFENISTAWF